MFTKSLLKAQAANPLLNRYAALRAFSGAQQTTGPKTKAGGTDANGNYIEPRFLENVQLMVENAAMKANIKPDMLKYIMSCDNVIRF
jgi:hypothetical protein